MLNTLITFKRMIDDTHRYQWSQFLLLGWWGSGNRVQFESTGSSRRGWTLGWFRGHILLYSMSLARSGRSRRASFNRHSIVEDDGRNTSHGGQDKGLDDAPRTRLTTTSNERLFRIARPSEPVRTTKSSQHTCNSCHIKAQRYYNV